MKTLVSVSIGTRVTDKSNSHQWDEIGKPKRCSLLHGDSDECGKTTNIGSPVVPVPVSIGAYDKRSNDLPEEDPGRCQLRVDNDYFTGLQCRQSLSGLSVLLAAQRRDASLQTASTKADQYDTCDETSE